MVKSQIHSALFFVLPLAGILCADDGLPCCSIRPVEQPKTVDVTTGVLYWHTGETVDWAFTVIPGQNSLKTSYKTFSFDTAPGFRIGLGYNMEHDQWDTQARYTWYQSKASSHTSGPVTPAFLAARLSLLEPFESGEATIRLHYNMFDWDLGRHYLISPYLTFRPAIGVRGGWITQSIRSNWAIDEFFTAFENIKQRFRGGGPTGGVMLKWCFQDIRCHSFSFISQFRAGYLWGKWSVRDQFTDDLFHTDISIKTLERNFGSFVLCNFTGIGWDWNFDHYRSHFGLKLGYEMENWLNHFQIFSDASGAQNNNLILQGLTFNLRLDF